ncbi:hypothetical protein Enr17x_40840 [Gimesia fumaroli]|uniref:Uncharacterized protein n=1 Tax=Gimesia fumaroli TaxID=2527976 RepID=A0A518IG23_9PLAN|nr:hypothetical protein Enr17x_40840 [Gimesia fumaroli]
MARVVSIIPKTPANSAITFVVYKILMTPLSKLVRYQIGVVPTKNGKYLQYYIVQEQFNRRFIQSGRLEMTILSMNFFIEGT